MKDKKLMIARIILTVLTVAAVAAIFYNSSLDADESTEQSSALLIQINRFLCSIGINIEITEKVLRKIAHFTEYTVLGALLCSTIYLYVQQRGKMLLISLPVGLAVAGCDELIQLIPAGRSSELRDVLIDFSGVLFAALIVTLITFLKDRKRKDKH